MNELVLSDNLAQIELEISHHKQIAGQSIWEIGRRLNHVKENDLAHGQFTEWIEKVGFNYSEANKMMRVSKELPKLSTLRDLGTSALYLIATLPDEQKTEQLERIENGDTPTVRELQEIKRENNRLKADLEEKTAQNERLAELALGKEEPQVIEKEVIKEVIPDDYESTKRLNQTLLNKNKELQHNFQEAVNSEAFVRNQLKKLQEERSAVDEKSARYDELTEAIKQSEGRLNSYQKKIASYKNIMTILEKGDKLLMELSGLIYADETHFINRDGIIKSEFNSLVDRGLKLFTDLDNKRQNDILEGEFI